MGLPPGVSWAPQKEGCCLECPCDIFLEVTARVWTQNRAHKGHFSRVTHDQIKIKSRQPGRHFFVLFFLWLLSSGMLIHNRE